MVSLVQIQTNNQLDFPVPNMPDSRMSPDTPTPVVKKELPKELTSHGTTPSGKPRLYVCSICTRAFARLEHLHRHERSHTKEKPFTCGVCQRKFSRRDLLLRHAQKLHAGCADAITRLRRKLLKNTPGSLNVNDSDLYSKDSNNNNMSPSVINGASGGPGVPHYNQNNPQILPPGFPTQAPLIEAHKTLLILTWTYLEQRKILKTDPSHPRKCLVLPPSRTRICNDKYLIAEIETEVHLFRRNQGLITPRLWSISTTLILVTMWSFPPHSLWLLLLSMKARG